ncbi:MAG: hypothetical protein ACK4ND_11680 [Cytophagaceae bacterium]
MTEAKFNKLTLKDKIQILYQEGTFMVAIRYYGYKVNLYMLDGFYVEVFYNHKWDKIELIEILDKHHSRMKFYLDQIQLPKI